MDADPHSEWLRVNDNEEDTIAIANDGISDDAALPDDVFIKEYGQRNMTDDVRDGQVHQTSVEERVSVMKKLKS